MKNATNTNQSGKGICFDPTVINTVAANGVGRDKQSLKATAMSLITTQIELLQPSIKDILVKASI
eukprot:7887981-Ditylum_brightwellii.AAC.1